jgi:hypothetical protein
MKSLNKSIALIALLVVSVFYSSPSFSKVYKNKRIGKYKVSYDLKDYDGTFLSFMKTEIYPALADESENITGSSRDFLGAIKRGEGVEIRLSKDVTTLHVKFQDPYADKAERSGRSFGVVGNTRRNYIADASYAHFLRTLEKISFKSDKELEQFYRVIFQILANSDSSGISKLSREARQVAADFVAVYVAEQYRHLINGRDRDGDMSNVRLGRGHNWDDAHLQVTMLAAFHGGQSKSNRYMIYEGEFTNKVFDQNTCLYRRFDEAKRNTTRKRSIQLKDYWQFSYRNECPGRSGVNITRGEFQEMGEIITDALFNSDSQDKEIVSELARELNRSTRGNMIKKISQFFISNSAPASLSNGGEDLVEAIVDFIMESHYDANEITEEELHERVS